MVNKSKLSLPKLRFKEFEGEYKEFQLNELYSNYNGLSGLNKENFEIGEDKFLPYKSIFLNDFVKFVDGEKINLKNKIQNFVKQLDILITGTSETINEIGISSVYLDNKKIYLNSFCFGLRSKDKELINSLYLNFLFKNSFYRKTIIKLGQGSTRYNLSKNEFMKIKILIPNVLEQNKITNFLLLFNKLIKLWERKLELYELIYEKYINDLKIIYDCEKEINKICFIKKGEQINKDNLLISGIYKYINGSKTPLGYLNIFNREKNTISICEGGDCGYTEWHNENFWSGGHSYTLHNIIDIIDDKYLYYLLKANYKILKSLATGSTLKNISFDLIKKFKIKYISNKDIQIKLKLNLEKIEKILNLIKLKISYFTKLKNYYINMLFI